LGPRFGSYEAAGPQAEDGHGDQIRESTSWRSPQLKPPRLDATG
jgi:hypothetical protein